MVGEHDFAAFAGPRRGERSTIREVHEVSLDREADLVIFGVAANAFLTHQIRNTVGTLIWVGTGKIDVAEFRRIMEGKNRRMAGPAAPPHGLFFMKVDYPAAGLEI